MQNRSTLNENIKQFMKVYVLNSLEFTAIQILRVTRYVVKNPLKSITTILMLSAQQIKGHSIKKNPKYKAESSEDLFSEKTGSKSNEIENMKILQNRFRLNPAVSISSADQKLVIQYYMKSIEDTLNEAINSDDVNTFEQLIQSESLNKYIPLKDVWFRAVIESKINFVKYIANNNKKLKFDIFQKHEDNDQGFDALSIACLNGHTAIMDILNQNGLIEKQRESDVATNCVYVSTFNSLKSCQSTLQKLVNLGYDINYFNNGKPPIFELISRHIKDDNFVDAFRLLIKFGRDTRIRYQGSTLLHQLVMHSTKNPIHISLLDQEGDKSMYIAVRIILTKDYLVDSTIVTADPYAVDSYGLTAMDYAVSQGDLSMIYILLDCGYNPLSKNARGVSLVDYVNQNSLLKENIEENPELSALYNTSISPNSHCNNNEYAVLKTLAVAMGVLISLFIIDKCKKNKSEFSPQEKEKIMKDIIDNLYKSGVVRPPLTYTENNLQSLTAQEEQISQPPIQEQKHQASKLDKRRGRQNLLKSSTESIQYQTANIRPVPDNVVIEKIEQYKKELEQSQTVKEKTIKRREKQPKINKTQEIRDKLALKRNKRELSAHNHKAQNSTETRSEKIKEKRNRESVATPRQQTRAQPIQTATMQKASSITLPQENASNKITVVYVPPAPFQFFESVNSKTPILPKAEKTLSSEDKTHYPSVKPDYFPQLALKYGKRAIVSCVQSETKSEKIGMDEFIKAYAILYNINRAYIAMNEHLKRTPSNSVDSCKNYQNSLEKILSDMASNIRTIIMHGSSEAPIRVILDSRAQLQENLIKDLSLLRKHFSVRPALSENEIADCKNISGMDVLPISFNTMAATQLHQNLAAALTDTESVNLQTDQGTEQLPCEDKMYVDWVENKMIPIINRIASPLKKDHGLDVDSHEFYNEHLDALKMLFSTCGEFYHKDRNLGKYTPFLKACRFLVRNEAGHSWKTEPTYNGVIKDLCQQAMKLSSKVFESDNFDISLAVRASSTKQSFKQ